MNKFPVFLLLASFVFASSFFSVHAAEGDFSKEAFVSKHKAVGKRIEKFFPYGDAENELLAMPSISEKNKTESKSVGISSFISERMGRMESMLLGFLRK